MKYIVLFFVLTSAAFSNELIHISDDTNDLDGIYQKYRQDLLISNNHVYLIPNECKLERYFGGASQGALKLVKEPHHTEEIIITQEVFEAKDIQDIQEKIDLDKSISLVQGKVAKEFLADEEGRGFGGASEVPIDYSVQKIAHIQDSTRSIEQAFVEKEKDVALPSCKLLEDGSGYQLNNVKEPKFYNNKGLFPLKTNNISFQ